MKRWWQGRPLWFRLLLWYAGVGTVLLSGFSALVFFHVRERMARPLDHQLRVDLEEVQRRLTIGPDRALTWNGRPLSATSAWATQYPWFELWDEKGHFVRRLWPFSENRVQQLPPVAPAPGRETISVFSVAPDLRLRVLSVPYELQGQSEPWMLRLMRLHAPAGDALEELRWIIFIALPSVIALLVVGGYLITRHWLTPLDRIAAEARHITAENIDRRLPVDNPHDELGRLAGVFNETLDRLAASFDALDRFVADASHELRTPLTTLRSVGEVGLRASRTPDEYREIIGSMLEEARRLQILVGRLLELAMAEGGAAAPHRVPVDVAECVGACVNDLSVLAEARGQSLELQAVPCTIPTDAVLFRQALQNLIDNAIKYSPPDSRIQIIVTDALDRLDISVIDEGPGIDSNDRHRLTDRFFRPDPSRQRSTGGFGLGLSITQAYMRVLGGSLAFEPVSPHGSHFKLSLPKA